MLPFWADVLIMAALPLILAVVLWIWGAEEPGNATSHYQEDGEGGDIAGPGGEPPDPGSEAGPGELAVAA